MNSNEHRAKFDDQDRLLLRQQYPPTARQAHEAPAQEFTLLVAGCRGGKTSFLRLLLDTSTISPRTTKDQLASVAKFVQGSSGHTSFIRTASVDINVELDANGQYQPLALTLLDTPSLDFNDDLACERILTDITRQIEQRFADGVEDDWKHQHTDRNIHLCVYFLDPDTIVPPSVPGPPPPIPRTRNNSFSQQDHEPVILEPPVTTNPLLAQPKLPPADVTAIRRLSQRVNVLPVIARADILSNDRLAAVKLAIRRDLAEAGIGFGIFDVDTTPLPHPDVDSVQAAQRPGSANGYGHPNGTANNSLNSPPTSPTATPPLLRLPYALISPDMYSHSDGVTRRMPSRHELVQQYTPSHYPPHPPFPRGKYVRAYRWGTLDVLEPAHSDFVALRNAMFHHMERLRSYTRQYLLDKFRSDYARHQQPPSRQQQVQQQQQQQQQQQALPPPSHLGPITHPARPILAIDTAPPHPAPHRHPNAIPAQPAQRDVYPGDVRNPAALHPLPEVGPNTGTTNSKAAAAPRASKQRTKKITVACNFCRSRKLKCDGGRPACGQCLKRNNPCDYMPQNKRRGTVSRQRKQGEESESESGGGDESPEGGGLEPSLSPEIASQPPSRRSSNAAAMGRHPQDIYTPSLPSVSALSDRRADSASSSSRHKLESSIGSTRSYFHDGEMPPITTLPLPEPSPPTPAPMSAPTLPPIRPASDLQAAQRKRAATVPGKSSRGSTSSGPKVVACNFCRARKTKCDGALPACASCARRQLDCNYVHDSGHSNGNGQKKPRRPSTSKALTADSQSHSLSPPSSRMVPTPSTANDSHEHMEIGLQLVGGGIESLDLKRPLDYPDMDRAPKKMRMDNNNNNPVLMHAGIP